MDAAMLALHGAGLRRFLVKHHSGFPLTVMICLQWAGAAVRVPVYFLQGVLTFNPGLFTC